MKKMTVLFILAAVFVLTQPVLAKSYVWGDPDFGFTVKYPDSWKAQGGLTPEQQLRVIATQSQAQCSFEASQDRRFLVYPRRFDKEILSNEFNWTRWENITANYEDRFFHFDKTGSLGRGDARYTVVDYLDVKNGVEKSKRELIYASIYGDMSFVARCASAPHNYDEFFDTFMRMISSVDFTPAYSMHKNSYYRNFLGNGYVKPKKPNFFTKYLPHKKIRPIYTAQ